jgi:hypothetical protein
MRSAACRSAKATKAKRCTRRIRFAVKHFELQIEQLAYSAMEQVGLLTGTVNSVQRFRQREQGDAMNQQSRRRTIGLGRSSCLLAVTALLAASTAFGQARAKPAAKPAAKPIDPKVVAAAQVREVSTEHNKLATKIRPLKNTGTIAATSRDDVEQFYGMYATMMTLPGMSTELPSLRQEIRRETVNWGAATDKTGLATVNQVLLAAMQKVAMDPKQTPLARFNCMMVIADLNDVETDRVGRGTPKAMAAAVPILLTAVTDEKVGDAVKVAALVGLLRHAELGIADKQIEKQVATELQKLAAEETVPEARSVDGHQWLRRRAIEIVTTIYAKQGTAPKEFSAALESIVANEELPLVFRAEAAESLGRVGGAQGTIVDALGETALAITKAELTPRGYRYYFRSVQRCLTGADSKGGVLPKLPLTEKKLGEELSELLKGINVRMDRIGNDPVQTRGQMVLEAQRIEDWMATYKTPEEEETTVPAKPAAPAQAAPGEIEAKADAPANGVPAQAAPAQAAPQPPAAEAAGTK